MILLSDIITVQVVYLTGKNNIVALNGHEHMNTQLHLQEGVCRKFTAGRVPSK